MFLALSLDLRLSAFQVGPINVLSGQALNFDAKDRHEAVVNTVFGELVFRLRGVHQMVDPPMR